MGCKFGAEQKEEKKTEIKSSVIDIVMEGDNKTKEVIHNLDYYQKKEQQELNGEKYNDSIFANYSNEVFKIINQIRAKPSQYADFIEDSMENIVEKQKGENKKIIFQKQLKVALNRGEPSFRKAATKLREYDPLPPFIFKNELCVPLPTSPSELSNKNYLKNKIQKRHQFGVLSKLNLNKVNKNAKTVSKLGIVYNKNKKNTESKNKENICNNCSNIKNKNNMKNNIQLNKNLIFSSTISTNSTINFGCTYTKLNTVSNNLKYNIDYQNFNETKENYTKKKNKYKMMKSLETLMNIGDRKNKICKERDLKRVFKLESDSIQSTTVSFNKKNKHKFSCTYTDKVLTQIKRTIKKEETRIKNSLMWGMKYFPTNFQKNTCKIKYLE